MKKKITSCQLIALFSFLYLSVTSCAPQNNVQVQNIEDGATDTKLITDEKVFNQCTSDTSSTYQVQFSESSGQSTQNDLTFIGTLGAGGDIPEVAKITLETAIQSHVGKTSTYTTGASESMQVTIPPRTKVLYTLIWKETIQTGTVQYVQNNVSKSADFSYRLKVVLESSSSTELSCINTPIPSGPTSTPHADIQPGVSDIVAGTWSGQLQSVSGAGDPHPLQITLNKGCNVGQHCGTYSESGFICIGDLSLLDIQDNVFIFAKTLSMGDKSCPDNSYLFIQPVSQGTIFIKAGTAPWIDMAQESGTMGGK